MTHRAEFASGIGAGFRNPVHSSQAVFRAVMEAVARPGSIRTVNEAVTAPSMLMPATAAIALSLFDHDTPVWLDDDLLETETPVWLRFQTGSPLISDSTDAAFGLIARGESLPEFERFSRGTPEYPDRSATLIVQVETLTDAGELLLSGPGIRDVASLRAGPLPVDFSERMQANHALFPRGVDLLLVSGAQFVALPRSVRVTVEEA